MTMKIIVNIALILFFINIIILFISFMNNFQKNEKTIDNLSKNEVIWIPDSVKKDDNYANNNDDIYVINDDDITKNIEIEYPKKNENEIINYKTNLEINNRLI